MAWAVPACIGQGVHFRVDPPIELRMRSHYEERYEELHSWAT